MYIAQKCSHGSDCWHVTEHPSALEPEDWPVYFSFQMLICSCAAVTIRSCSLLDVTQKSWAVFCSQLFPLHVHRKPPSKLFKPVQDASWVCTFLTRVTSWPWDFSACLFIQSSFIAVDLFATTAISDATYSPIWKNCWYGNIAAVDYELFIYDKLKQW